MAKLKINDQLNEEEKEILQAYESGTLASAPVPEEMVLAAKATMRKNKNINIRISENDLEAIKLLAAKEGCRIIPGILPSTIWANTQSSFKPLSVRHLRFVSLSDQDS